MANNELLRTLLGDKYNDGMTNDDIVKALSEIEGNPLKDAQDQAKTLKTRLSEANSEAANFKKQLREKMTADEAAKKRSGRSNGDTQETA